MTFLKLAANAVGPCKWNDANDVCWWHWTDHYVIESYAVTCKTGLLKVKCRDIWSCKLIYPVICRLTLKKSDPCKISAILNIM